MDDIWMRFMADMSDRVTGPMKFRFVLQPVMAINFAAIAGLKDAELGKPPHVWGLLSDPVQRGDMLEDGWKCVGKVFGLAIVPHLLLRGLGTRIARKD